MTALNLLSSVIIKRIDSEKKQSEENQREKVLQNQEKKLIDASWEKHSELSQMQSPLHLSFIDHLKQTLQHDEDTHWKKAHFLAGAFLPDFLPFLVFFSEAAAFCLMLLISSIIKARVILSRSS